MTFCELCMIGILFTQAAGDGIIMTVQGEIPASDLGKTLAHEHVMCDFIGAEKTGKHRYDANEIVDRMSPFLKSIANQGFSGFVDCTPAYIGRDVEVLRRISRLTGVHILTNTGYYGAAGDKYVPEHAYRETPDQLAERWVAEWENGIDGTNIKPGFIKIGVDSGELSAIDAKLVRAAARAHLKTGLTIACHTGEATAALAVLEIVESEGVHPSALIVVHADGIADRDVHYRLAESGAWIEYDGVSEDSIERHTELIGDAIKRGYTDRLLLSHDAGWYSVGESEGGNVRPFTTINDRLVPALLKSGVTEQQVNQILITNPARAFRISVRRK